MDEKQNIVDQEMLYKYFMNQLTSAERASVDQWIKLSIKNQEEFNQAQIFYLDLHALLSVRENKQGQETDIAWQKFKSIHQIKESENQLEWKNNFRFSILKVAAGISFLVIVGWLLYFDLTKTEWITLESDQSVRSIELMDGSNVTLNKSSILSHPEEFNTSQRRVRLEGEAFFKVQANPSHPFIIELNGCEVEVLGTEFNVKQETDHSTTVHVTEGVVRLSSDKKYVILTKGQKASFDNESGFITQAQAFQTTNQSFWRTRKLSFRNSPLHEVVKTLRDSYESDISLKSESLNECRITVDFEHEKLDNIIEIISKTLNLNYKKDDQSYILSGEGCL